jgi:preprotein translocase subunit SecD
MDFYRDNRFLFLLLMFMVFAAGVTFVAGWLLIAALVFFGFASTMWKETHIKLASISFLVLLALINIGANGLNFGIDFVGGTRIPVVLDQAVDQVTMNELVQSIKSRASTLGLKEVKARAIGNSLVNVEIASSDEDAISFIEQTLSQQGVFQGIVDGKVAVSGDNIFRTSITPLAPQELLQQGADWGVRFSVDREGAEQFADAAKGKADYPIYMYLDRPVDAVLFYEKEAFKNYILQDSGEKETLGAIEDALRLEGNDIPVYIIENGSVNATPATNNTIAIVSSNMSEANENMLRLKGFTLEETDPAKMAPELSRSRSGVLIVNRLEAVGLLTGPLLSGQITTGVPNYGYVVSGGVNAIDPQLKAAEVNERVKSIVSILKGGALPVQISLGSRTTLPASLGSEFLRLSLIAIAGSLVLISVLIGIRYRNVRATLPIIIISMAELTILLSVLGSFTIDLAAMAGIIAAIGVGVDAQIVITDELLRRDGRKTSDKIEFAFGVIKTNAIVAIFSMVPLLFSGLVEIIGFAISTMLGALLGYLLTRPAYAAIVEKVLEAEKKGASAEGAA